MNLIKNLFLYVVTLVLISAAVFISMQPSISKEEIDLNKVEQRLLKNSNSIVINEKGIFLTLKESPNIYKVKDISNQELEKIAKSNNLIIEKRDIPFSIEKLIINNLNILFFALIGVFVFAIIDTLLWRSKLRPELKLGFPLALYIKKTIENFKNFTNFKDSPLIYTLLIGLICYNTFKFVEDSKPFVSSNGYVYSDLIKDIKQLNVEFVEIQVKDNISQIKVQTKKGEIGVLSVSETTSLKELMNNYEIRYNEKNLGQSFDLTPFIITGIILVIAIVLANVIGRKMANKNSPFASKEFEVLTNLSANDKISIDKVKGIDEIMPDIKEVIELLKTKNQVNNLGGRTPKAMLFDGSPGVGKTLLAKVIAKETGYNCIVVNGSSFAGQLQGQGTENIKNLFKKARENQPCIIFMDEIDGVGRKRGQSFNGEDSDRTLNQLLVEMDGFSTDNENLFIIGATNFPERLDPALTRAGRFDRHITIPLPNFKGRMDILNLYLQKVKAASDINLESIAHHTSGFSGAALENLINESALLAARKEKELIDKEDIEEAKDKIMMGNKLAIEMSEKEKWMTAYHESGHALVSLLDNKKNSKVHKISIIPRGRALGVTMYVPEEEKYSVSKEEIEADIRSLYGGRIAEELVLGKSEVSTGASHDFEVATKKAEAMIKHFGLNENSLLTLGYKDQNGQMNLSIEDKKAMEDILKRNYDRSYQILKDNKEMLLLFTKALIYFDSIESDQIENLIKGIDITEGKQIYIPEGLNILNKETA